MYFAMDVLTVGTWGIVIISMEIFSNGIKRWQLSFFEVRHLLKREEICSEFF